MNDGAVEAAVIAQQRVSVVATDDAARLQVVGTVAFRAGHLLAVARKVHRLQALAGRTCTVVGPETIEVGEADKETDAVAGTEHIAGVVLAVGTDDIVLAGCLAVVAGHVDMTDRRCTVTRRGHEDVRPRVFDGRKQQTGRVLVAVEEELTWVLPADRRLGLTS